MQSKSPDTGMCEKHKEALCLYCQVDGKFGCQKCLEDHKEHSNSLVVIDAIKSFYRLWKKNVDIVNSKKHVDALQKDLLALKLQLDEYSKTLDLEAETIIKKKEDLVKCHSQLPSLEAQLPQIHSKILSFSRDKPERTGMVDLDLRKKTNEFEKNAKSFLKSISSGFQTLFLSEKLSESASKLDPLYSTNVVHLLCSSKKELIKFDIKKQSTSFQQKPISVDIPQKSVMIYVFPEIFVLGGINSYDNTTKLDDVFSIHIENCKFTKKKPLPSKKSGFGIASIGKEYIVIAGGMSTELERDVHQYSILNDYWEDLPKLSEPKTNLGLCNWKNKYLYCIGGFTWKETPILIERLSFERKDKWEIIDFKLEKENDFNYPIFEITPVQFDDKSILIYGGRIKQNWTKNTFLLIINEEKDSHVISQGLSLSKADSFCYAMSPIVKDKSIVSISDNNNMHIFNKETGSWEFIKQDEWQENSDCLIF